MFQYDDVSVYILTLMVTVIIYNPNFLKGQYVDDMNTKARLWDMLQMFIQYFNWVI